MVLLYNPHLKIAARELRTNMTESEKLVWSLIRGKKLCGVQFYRQKTIGPYIVDFYGPSVNLVIEIDGAHHLKKEILEQDQDRDAYLQALGLMVLRFSNFQVKNNMFKIAQAISIAIHEFEDAHKIVSSPTLKKGVDFTWQSRGDLKTNFPQLILKYRVPIHARY